MKKATKVLKKYFIPHEENDHKPHLLRARTIAFVCLVAIAAESAFLFGSAYVVPRSRLFGEILANVLVDETNQNRVTDNLSPLTVSPLLQGAAQDKANDMATKGYFAHTSPDGITPWYWFEKVGYGFTYAGENLAVNFVNSEDVTNAWMNSPEHRANILNGNFTEIGMASAQGTFQGQPAIYVVELFGRPSPAPAPASLAFTNTAAASGVSASATPSPSPVVQPSPAPKPAPKPVAPKSAPKPAPLVVASTSEISSNSQQLFVAVKGAETQAASATDTSATVPAQSIAPASEVNPLQRAVVDPRQLANYFYYILILVFAVGLGLNIFIKIRIQYPKLIFAGMLVIVMAGLFVVLNQHVALLNATIL